MYNAISLKKNEFGVYQIIVDINPIDFDANIYFIYDSSITPDIDNIEYLKPFINKKVIAFSDVEKTLKKYSDFYIINNYWNILYSDYKQARLDMKIKLNAIGFDNLTIEDKKIVSAWYLVNRVSRDTVYNLNEQMENSKLFHYYSTISRENRLNYVIMEVYNQFNTNDSENILSDSAYLMDLYKEFGREGTLEGNIEGLFDYIEARIGTSYETTGLLNSGLTPIDYTLSDLVNYTMDILKFGFY